MAGVTEDAVMTVLGQWGSEFLVNTSTSGNQNGPDVATLVNGRFVTTWIDQGQTVRAQFFDHDGIAVGSEFAISDASAVLAGVTHVAALSNENFVVTWTDNSSGAGANSLRQGANRRPLRQPGRTGNLVERLQRRHRSRKQHRHVGCSAD